MQTRARRGWADPCQVPREALSMLATLLCMIKVFPRGVKRELCEWRLTRRPRGLGGLRSLRPHLAS